MSSNSNYEYEEGEEIDVFLSFRGGDTRKGFTSHLYNSLHNAQVRVFKDNVNLTTGEVIKDQLFKGIRHSKISIPILSQNYAQSKWCLMELALIMECRKKANQIVLPIFYNVEPRDVRHQTGTYQNAFDMHIEGKHDKEIVAEWRNALSDVGQLKGCTPSDTNGDEGELVKTVVADVMKKLKKDHVMIPKNSLLGVEDPIHALSHKQKYIFLNIACLWIKKMKYAPNYVWEDHFNGSVSHEIKELRSRSLIKIKGYKYWMDDKLRDRARAIVQREYNDQGKQVWLWRSKEGTNLLMKNNKLMPQVEAICLNDDQFEGEQFKNMPNLRFIKMRDADLAGNFEGALREVRYLEVDASFRHCIQSLSLESIVALNLSDSGVADDWSWSTMKVSSKMKDLNLGQCHQLKRGPNFSLFPNLERLDVEGCKNLVSVDLSSLKLLKDLDASNCTSLQDIHGLDQLERLNWLDISNCKAIKKLPTLSKLKKLGDLNAEGCIRLQRLEGVEGLEALEELNISGCAAMKQLPNLSNLKRLRDFKKPNHM